VYRRSVKLFQYRQVECDCKVTKETTVRTLVPAIGLSSTGVALASAVARLVAVGGDLTRFSNIQATKARYDCDVMLQKADTVRVEAICLPWSVFASTA
jgi:hypothetical protein